MHSFATLALFAAAVSAVPVWRRAAPPPPDAATITQLAPSLGVSPPLPSTGFGDCFSPVIGANGKNASVPCACPPTQAAFVTALVRDVQLGHAFNNPGVAVTFPTGSSIADAQGRISAAAVTLQNLNGEGKGCPIVSTLLQAQSKALDALASQGVSVAPASLGGGDATAAVPAATQSAAAATTPAPANTPPPAASSSAAAASSTAAAAESSGIPTAAQIAALAPSLGVTGPLPPTGAGDCKGPTLNAAGQPISVPCACPPSQADFITALTADVLAGHALKNPSVKVSFPTGSSVQDQLDRIGAASVTLQNLNGVGQGCPFVSTTLPAQSKALQAQLA